MDRSEFLDRLANAEWECRAAARRLSGQQNALRSLRSSMRDTSGAEALLRDFEFAQVWLVHERDRILSEIQRLDTTKV